MKIVVMVRCSRRQRLVYRNACLYLKDQLADALDEISELKAHEQYERNDL